MAAIASITVFDGAATPVSHTLVAESISREADGTLVASWKEALTSVPDYAQIKVTGKKKRLPTGITRSSFRVEVPVMESVSGVNSSGYTAAPKVAYIDTVEIVNYASDRSTVEGRRLVRQLAINLAGNVSTTVTPSTAGPVPNAFDTLVFPT